MSIEDLEGSVFQKLETWLRLWFVDLLVVENVDYGGHYLCKFQEMSQGYKKFIFCQYNNDSYEYPFTKYRPHNGLKS